MKYSIGDVATFQLINKKTGEVIAEKEVKTSPIEREYEMIDYYYKGEKIISEEVTHTDTIKLDCNLKEGNK